MFFVSKQTVKLLIISSYAKLSLVYCYFALITHQVLLVNLMVSLLTKLFPGHFFFLRPYGLFLFTATHQLFHSRYIFAEQKMKSLNP
jgi:hypothetical protein